MHLYDRAIQAGVLPPQDPASLEISTRRVIHGAVTHYHEFGFTDTAERDTAAAMLRLAGVAADDLERILDRVAELMATSEFEMPTSL